MEAAVCQARGFGPPANSIARCAYCGHIHPPVEDKKVECLMCGVKRHPTVMCVIAESVEGELREYYCQECRWGL